MTHDPIPVKIEPGMVVFTQGFQRLIALHDIGEHHVQAILSRYCQGDWGDLCLEDQAVNMAALPTKDRIMGLYKINKDVFWIITDAGWEVTTFLLPEEY